VPKHVGVVICVKYILLHSEFFGRYTELTVTLAGHDRAVGNNVTLIDG
jgi:hypothetical protein